MSTLPLELNAAAIEAEAQRVAHRFDYDHSSLSFQKNRYSFGSLSHQWNAAFYRKVYWRAMEIAEQRNALLQAAE